MQYRQTNLYEFLDDLLTATEQELHKQTTEEYQNTSAEAAEPSLKEITTNAYRNALRNDNVEAALRYWYILKDMHDSNYGDL